MPDQAINQPGIYPALDRVAYEAIPGANYSLLKHFARSPMHARYEMTHPKEPTDAMELGTAIHTAVLEPERFAAEYVHAPKVDRRTKEGKATWAAFESDHPGRDYLADDEWAQCEGMAAAVRAHPLASQLLYGQGRNEVTIVWKDAKTGLLCKGRLDRFTQFMGWSVVIDLKSARDASQWAFQAAMARLAYHSQVAYYLDGLRALADMDRRFLIVSVESDPPHGIMVYELDDQALAEGRAAYRRHLDQYAECVRTGVWPGYREGIWPLSLPRWALTGENGGDENG